MTVSVGDSFIIALVAIICLGAFIAITLLADRRPYFKHPKQTHSPTGVSGGVHVGDPRSRVPHGEVRIEGDEQASRDEMAGRPRSG